MGIVFCFALYLEILGGFLSYGTMGLLVYDSMALALYGEGTCEGYGQNDRSF